MATRVVCLLSLLLGQSVADTRVSCSATTGNFLIQMTPEKGPIGAKRFLELVEDGFFTEIPMFRVLPGFLVQYGIPGRMDLKANWEKWTSSRIKDDPHLGPNNKDVVCFPFFLLILCFFFTSHEIRKCDPSMPSCTVIHISIKTKNSL